MDKKVNELKLKFLIGMIIISMAISAIVLLRYTDVTGQILFVLLVVAADIVIYFLFENYIKNNLKETSDKPNKVSSNIYDQIEHNTQLPCLIMDSVLKESIDSKTKEVIKRYTNNIIWINDVAKEMFHKKDMFGKDISDFINLDLETINDTENEIEIANYIYEDKHYDIKIQTVKKKNKNQKQNKSKNSKVKQHTHDVYKVLYFYDVTDKINMQNKYEEEKTLFGYVYIDNYEEILNSTEEIRRPMMLGIIERKLQTFAKEMNGTIKKMEKDRFLLIISKENLEKVIEGKLKILEEIRKISVGNEFPITLSIGFSFVGDSIETLMENSKDAAEIAVSRGGDQAVIKRDENDYEYYGARGKQEVDSTVSGKAKVRIKAYAMKELITSADNVLIMGHKNPDLDALGAAMGMYRLSIEMGKKSKVILDSPNNAIEVFYNKIKNSDNYPEDVFISHEDALKQDLENTLLIVVDVNIPNMTECPEIIDKVDKIAIIDHHIRGMQFIESAKMIYLDPFASSACEEVIQLSQYIIEKIKYTEDEVDGMLAGILVDTKNFMYKTGVKTFEAAAYLKKCGADNIRVKYLFQNDLNSYKKKADAMKKAQVYKDKTIITTCPKDVSNASTLTAQIADDLLNIIGIEASFVVFDTGSGCNVSARSNGNINVQLIAEELGGGGHFTAAGVQFSGITVEETIQKIKAAIDEYLKEDSGNK